MKFKLNIFNISNMNVGAKIATGVGMVVVLLVFIVGFTVYNLNNLAMLQDEGAGRADDAVRMQEAAGMGAKMYQIIADAIINRDLDETMVEWEPMRAEAHEDLDWVATAVDTPEEIEFAKEADGHLDEIIALFENEMLPVLRTTEGITEEIRTFDFEMDELLGEFEEPIMAIAASLHEEMVEADEMFDGTRTSTTNVSIFLGILAVVLAVAFTIFIVRLIMRPINDMITVLTDIEQGEGDLTVRVNLESADEIGTMSRLFDSFLAKTQDMFKNILTSSASVATAAGQISSSSEELAAGSEEQQAQLSEIATTMEEMSAMILEASKNADNTRSQAQETGNAAKQGRTVVSETVTGFESVAATVGEASKQIDELSRRSEEIGNVIQVIDDIADQTNLLALNANIEAARAGDAGRGFAVVADEVRKLAERTVSATAEISQMIESIQGDIRLAVKSMETTSGQSEEGLKLVAQSDKSLEEIAGGITSVVSSVESIATSANEQSTGAEEISKNIEGVTTVAKQSASSAQEMAASAESLNNEVTALNDLIGQFKVE
jgi:methyl-accepting chemotaxis protein